MAVLHLNNYYDCVTSIRAIECESYAVLRAIYNSYAACDRVANLSDKKSNELVLNSRRKRHLSMKLIAVFVFSRFRYINPFYSSRECCRCDRVCLMRLTIGIMTT